MLPLMAAAQTQVTEFIPGAVANGVNYALPKTAVVADVYAQKVVYTPGEFARYAERFLHRNDAIKEQMTEWTVTKLNIRQVGVPDTLKYYTVKLKDKSTAPFVHLSNEGILLAVNTNVDQTEVSLPADRKSAPHVDAMQYLTEEILMATSKVKMAELVAEEILAIRESKNEIKRGQVDAMPKDGESLRIVLDELNRQEEALTSMFIGYADTVSTAKTITYLPDGEAENDVLFRFSSKLGFVDADDLAGAPYYISIKDKHTVNQPTEQEAAKRKVVGLIYNMPGIAHVTVSAMDATVLYEHDLPFAQFGTVDALSPTLFNKGATTKVTLNPATGGILHLDQ